MGSDLADPAWRYAALAGVFPFSGSCALAAIALAASARRG
jgi:hypothetical protein